MKKEKKDFLLEINVEELPAGYVRPGLDRLKDSLRKMLKEQRVNHGEILTYGNATKLICCVKDVAEKQEEFSEEVMGPPKKIAFDKDNKPTPQAIGFAKNQGVDIVALKVKSLPKGDYVFVEKKAKARSAKDILHDFTPEIIKSISFPKVMRWDGSGLRFARPIESVAALLDEENIKIKLGNVPEKRIKNLSAIGYVKMLKKGCLIDPDERKKTIEGMVKSTQRRLGLDEEVDQGLLEEINFMVRMPVIMVGEFDKRFLNIPRDVLAASMSKYQRVFTVSMNKKLVNKFIAVIDGKGRDTVRMKKVYANILEARLKDSLFFFNEDSKKPLEGHTAELKDLIFQRDLGSMFEKIQRLEEICSFLCDRLNINGPGRDDIRRAAHLCKSDLVTQMVREFPSLQGSIGMEYALRSGERQAVAKAIKEHYLPKGLDDELPVTLEGAILAISDRIDNITGLIGTGVELKASSDPFGIRRNSQGLVRIINDKGFRLELAGLIDKTISLYKGKLKIGPEELRKRIIAYIKERIESVTPETRQVELKHAVLAAGSTDIVDIFKRLKEISGISKEKYFLKAAKVCERTGNILKGAKGERIGEVNAALFKEDLERKVWDAYLSSSGKVQGLIKEERYADATRMYGEAFFENLHEFFDKVLVNVDDNALRMNRLAMMQAINKLYTEKVADLAMLPQIIVE